MKCKCGRPKVYDRARRTCECGRTYICIYNARRQCWELAGMTGALDNKRGGKK